MLKIQRARVAAEAQGEAAKALHAAYLRAIFNSPEAQQWPRRHVSQLCDRVDYGFTASADFTVKEPRFLRITDIQNGGVDWGKVPGCQISPAEEAGNRLVDGDIVFARTGATTGKSFLIKQPPRSVFASYLIRLRPNNEVTAEYMYAFFQSDGYWKQIRASARGGAQPNVNATLLGAIALPLPTISEQRHIAARLSERMAAVERTRKALVTQLATINALPAALLRRAFSGELTQRRLLTVQPKLPKGIYFKRGAIASYIINRLHRRSTFGRVQFEKVLYLTETHVGIDLGGRYKREDPGPLDSDFLYKLESLASKQRWFVKRRRGAEGFFYRPGPSISNRLRAAELILGNRRKKMDGLLDLILRMKTEQVEALTTVFAAWNDFLFDGRVPTDQEIIREVRENWHVAKERFSTNKLQAVLDWMRDHKIIPRGIGPRTEVTNGQA